MTVYVLHYVSKLGMFMLLYGLICLILKFTIGFIPFIKNTTIYGWPLEAPLFGIIAIVIIGTFVEISSPYASMLGK